MGVFYDSVRERFLRYARIDTQSASGAAETPSTSKQFDLARVLRDELIAIGVSDVWLDEEHCVVYGVIPSNTEGGMPIGYVAHMDTATEASHRRSCNQLAAAHTQLPGGETACRRPGRFSAY